MYILCFFKTEGREGTLEGQTLWEETLLQYLTLILSKIEQS